MNVSNVTEELLLSNVTTPDELLPNQKVGKYRNTSAGRRIVVIGCGSVGRCALPLLHQLLTDGLKPRSIIVLDCIVPSASTLAWLKSVNMRFEQEYIEENSFRDILCKYLSKTDVLLDLAFNVSTEALVRWCQQEQVLYVNTTVDVWFLTGKDGDLFRTHHFDLFQWQERLLEMQSQLCERYGKATATAIVEHGANPGLVSHFVKKGLQDMAEHVLRNHMITDVNRLNNLEDALGKKNHARIAYLLGIKVIHISERDSQITSTLRKPNEIVNTWSPSSLCEEATGCVQFSWGTHERQVPKGGLLNGQPTQKWPPQRLCIPERGMDVWIRTWVPSGSISGMAVPHPESFSIADYLTVRDDHSSELLYQPSVYFIYLPCDAAICSLKEWSMQNYPPLTDERILRNDIVSGADELGVLLLGGHEISAWWTGSILDIHETRRLVADQSATTLQVAIGAVAAVIYALRHPNEGVRFPEQIDTEEILKTALPFLGTWVSEPVNWPWESIPVDNSSVKEKDDSQWQFRTFFINSSEYESF